MCMHFLHFSTHTLILEVSEDLSWLHSALSKCMPTSLNICSRKRVIKHRNECINVSSQSPQNEHLPKLPSHLEITARYLCNSTHISLATETISNTF